MEQTDARVVLTTVASAEEAQRLVRTLLERRLIACGTLLPRARSWYRWNDAIADETEFVVLLKTTAERVPALEQAVRAVNLATPVLSGRTFETSLQRIFHAQPRFSLIIVTTFATVGLLLVAIGVYGVMAYAVSRRSQEFAIRMALGATGGDVVRIVVRSGALLLAGGILIGLLVSHLTNALVVHNVLVSATNVDMTVTGVVAVGVIVTVGLAACLIPAARAARTSPMRALRAD